jgi:hypothetical protein
MHLAISKLKPNPENPRLIKDEAFAKLVQSVKDFPEMLEAREIVVNKDYVILGGNMRFNAAKEAGFKEVPVKVVDWPEDKQREFMAKDNSSSGDWDWDKLANEWDVGTLDDWGVRLPSFMTEEDGTVDHFRDADADSNLRPAEDYANSTTNTLILIYNNTEYATIIEAIKDENPCIKAALRRFKRVC